MTQSILLAYRMGQWPATMDMAPSLCTISKKKNRTLSDALQNNNWVQDIDFMHHNISARHFTEYITLWRIAQRVTLRPDLPDTVTWKLTANGDYTTKSAYQAQFLGSTANNFNKLIWRNWAPPKCKFFRWLALQDRLWTSDRLAARGWPNNGVCPLCRCVQESGIHLFKGCRVTRGFGRQFRHGQPPFICALKIGLQVPQFMTMVSTPSFVAKGQRTLILLVCLLGDLEGAQCQNFLPQGDTGFLHLLGKIKDEISLWTTAGTKHLSALF